jgi:hypothetical protein
LKTPQQPAPLEIGQKCSQRLTRSSFFADAGKLREGGIPDLNDQMNIGCKNAD